MAPQWSDQFYGDTRRTNGTAPPSSSQQRLALDNLIRRELKVADPSDPNQVAQALLMKYQADPRAMAIAQEAQGLPFLPPVLSPAVPVQSQTSSSTEWDQALSDVNRDLQELTTNAILKDVSAELQGWAQAIRSATAEGVNAARFALDPRQRDKAFAIRRQLGDYARMARLVGALTPAVNPNYRKMAQSLDEAAAVLLVMMGEALSNVGFAGGRFFLQAPYSELQVRRDAAIYALRNLVGATQEAYGPNDWPRGLDAYRRLFDTLEAQGQGDLRALLVEAELARTMDELIQRAANGTADGLRALGSTAQLDLDRFRRLVVFGQRAVSPESPPLTSFLEALSLFAAAFDSSGGFRLMRIARPPILFYGLYGTSGLGAAEQRLLDLIIQRGLLADILDCFMACACAADAVTCQIILDKILYDVDRAIDLYALGKEDFGQPERRAAAYSYLIDEFVTVFATAVNPATGKANCDLTLATVPPDKTLSSVLTTISTTLRPALAPTNAGVKAARADLVSFGTAVRNALLANGLCSAPDPADPSAPPVNLCLAIGDPVPLPNDLAAMTSLLALLQYAHGWLEQNRADSIPTPPAQATLFLGILQQELCIQREMEQRWESLVQTMAPNCAPAATIFDTIDGVIDGAIRRVSGVPCLPAEPSLPPHFETSLDGLVENVLPSGTNRKRL